MTSAPPPSSAIFVSAVPLIVPLVIPVLSSVVIVIELLSSAVSAPAALVTAVMLGPLAVGDRHSIQIVELGSVSALVSHAYLYLIQLVENIKARQGDTVEVTVSNTGCTLSREEVSRVFEPFWRGDASRKDAGVHCGLGLAVARTVIEAMGGAVRGDLEQGGVFAARITLPCAKK